MNLKHKTLFRRVGREMKTDHSWRISYASYQPYSSSAFRVGDPYNDPFRPCPDCAFGLRQSGFLDPCDSLYQLVQSTRATKCDTCNGQGYVLINPYNLHTYNQLAFVFSEGNKLAGIVEPDPIDEIPEYLRAHCFEILHLRLTNGEAMLVPLCYRVAEILRVNNAACVLSPSHKPRRSKTARWNARFRTRNHRKNKIRKKCCKALGVPPAEFFDEMVEILRERSKIYRLGTRYTMGLRGAIRK